MDAKASTYMSAADPRYERLIGVTALFLASIYCLVVVALVAPYKLPLPWDSLPAIIVVMCPLMLICIVWDGCILFAPRCARWLWARARRV